MTFESDIAEIFLKILHRQTILFFDVSDALHESIKEGSSTTGSPGQPVQLSDLKLSWHLRHLEPFLAQTSTPSLYARNIEEGIGSGGKQLTLRSEVGGFHSVKTTRVGFQKLVDEIARNIV